MSPVCLGFQSLKHENLKKLGFGLKRASPKWCSHLGTVYLVIKERKSISISVRNNVLFDKNS